MSALPALLIRAAGLVRVAGLAGCLACGTVLSGCAPTLNWREVALPASDGLRLSMPCKPEQHERHVPWPSVPEGVTMHLASCQTEAMTWAVSWLTLPQVQQVGPALLTLPQQMRQNLLAAAQTGEGGANQVVASQDLGAVQVPGMTPMAQSRGWQFAAQRPDGLGRPMDMVIRTWHFSHGLTVFQASLWRPAEALKPQSSEDVADVFFRSFHFPG
jgi:hypothetical protein